MPSSSPDPAPPSLRLLGEHVDLQQIQQEHEDRNAEKQPPYTHEMLGYDKDSKGIEYRQMHLRGHELRIQNIRFNGMNDDDHDDDHDHLAQPADAEGDRGERNQRDDNAHNRDETEHEDHNSQSEQ